MARIFAFIAVLAASLLIAAVALRPPATPDFDSGPAMAIVREIGSVPHPTGSPQNAIVRERLVARLQDLGMQVEFQPFALPAAAKKRLSQWGDAATSEAQGVNIIAVLPGRDASLPATAVMAHYDSFGGSPGAADDAAGIASALETARLMKVGQGPRRDLILILTDAEEISLGGSKAFFTEHPLAARVGTVINLEARGGGGRAAMFETSCGNAQLMALFGKAAPRPTAHSMAMAVYRFMPNSTDFTNALKARKSGFNIAFLGRPGLYHSPMATPDALDQGALRHMGSQTLALVHALDQGPALPGKSDSDAVFADIFGLFLIVAPPWSGWAVLAVCIAAVAATAALSRKTWRAREIVLGLLFGLVLLIGLAVLLQAANMLSGAGPGAKYYDRLASTHLLELAAFCLTIGALILLPRRLLGATGGWIGLTAAALLVAAAVQAVAPVASPLVLWPILPIALCLLVHARADPAFDRPRLVMNLGLCGALTTAFLLYWAHMLFLGVGQDYPAAMAPIALLAAAALWPLLQPLPRRFAAIAGLILILAGVGMATHVRLDAPRPEAARLG